MNVLTHYIWQSLRRSRRLWSLLLMTSIAAGLISTVFFFLALLWHDQSSDIESRMGTWHYLLDMPSSRQIQALQKDPAVEGLYYLGKDTAYRLPAGMKTPFLVANDADQGAMDVLGGAKAILHAGRLPQNNRELILSQSLLRDNDLVIGDRLDLERGQRLAADGHRLSPRAPLEPGETFTPQGTETFTIVGAIEASPASTQPFKFGLIGASPKAMAAAQPAMVMVRLHHPSQGYQLLPHFARLLGLDPDKVIEGGADTPLHTNDMVLMSHFAIPPQALSDKDVFKQTLLYPLAMLAVILLICAVFIFLVSGAFATWQAERRRHWGLFKSLGASPRQIRRAIARESALIALPSALFGAGLGYLVIRAFAHSILAYQVNNHLESRITMYLPWPWLLFTLLFSGGIIYLSGRRIARPIARCRPLELLREDARPPRRARRGSRSPALLLSRSALDNQRAMRRTARFAILLTMVSLLALLLMVARGQVSNDFFFAEQAKGAQIHIAIRDGNGLRPDLIRRYTTLPGVQDHYRYRSTTLEGTVATKALPLSKEDLAAGLESDALRRQGDQLSMEVYLVGLPREAFHRYAESLGLDPARGGILYRRLAFDPLHPEHVIDLGATPFPTLTLHPAKDEGQGEMVLRLAGSTDKLPAWSGLVPDNQLQLIVDEATYEDAIGLLDPELRFFARKEILRLRVNPAREMPLYRTIKADLAKAYPAPEDYDLYAVAANRRDADASIRYLRQLIFGGALLLAAFALIAAHNTIRQSLLARRRQILLLTALGMDRAGLVRTLAVEGLRFFLQPVLGAFLLAGPLLYLASNREALDPKAQYNAADLLAAMPWPAIFGFILLLALAIALSYAAALRQLRTDHLSETLREDAL